MAGGRILALDVGERRIGVALSDPLRLVARPLTVIRRASKTKDFAAIGKLVAEHDASLVLCGYPLSLDGTEGPQGRRIRRYAERLAEALPVEVELWDESYSTEEAVRMMASHGRLASRERRGWVDAVAAAVILQSYLDSLARPAGAASQ